MKFISKVVIDGFVVVEVKNQDGETAASIQYPEKMHVEVTMEDLGNTATTKTIYTRDERGGYQHGSISFESETFGTSVYVSSLGEVSCAVKRELNNWPKWSD